MKGHLKVMSTEPEIKPEINLVVFSLFDSDYSCWIRGADCMWR